VLVQLHFNQGAI